MSLELRDQEIINRVTTKRMQNNILWMQIVEIALEFAPEEAKRVMRQINENDQAISDLWKDLAKW